MNEPSGGEIKVILSSGHIKEWQDEWLNMDARIKEAEAKVTELHARKKEIYEKLRAAMLFAPEIGEWIRQQEEVNASEDTALTDAILKLLTARGAARPLNRELVRRKLPAYGYPEDKLIKNPNYLYVALSRLKERGRVKEVNGAFSIAV